MIPIMRYYLLGLLLCLFALAAHAQESGDTTVYTVLKEGPRFPACEQLDTTLSVKNQCAQQSLLAFMYKNIVYPMEARQNGHEGTVVVSFVVEKDGSISNSEIMRNVEGGCGEEVLRIVNAMNEAEIKWVPGQKDGQAVRARFTLPIKFKLEELPPFVIVQGDSVWVEFDESLSFKGGDEALKAHLDEAINYPESGKDSCLVGTMDVQVLVKGDGDVRILDVTDYNDLGFDFWYEAVNAATSTLGKWNVATYEGRTVPAAYDLGVSFFPTEASCKTAVENYTNAQQLAVEGLEKFNSGEKEAGLEKLSEAITTFPKDANLLYIRAQAYMDMKRFDEACADFESAKAIASASWFDNVLPILCK